MAQICRYTIVQYWPANGSINTNQSSSGYDHSISDESTVQQACYDCTITKMVIKLQAGPGTGYFRRFTVRKNGVDTALSITFYGSQTYKTNQTFVTFSATPFDLISIKEEFQFGATESAFSLSLVATTTSDRQVLVMGNPRSTSSLFFANRYMGIFQHNIQNTTDPLGATTIVSTSGQIKNIRLLTPDNPHDSDLDSAFWLSAIKQSSDGGTIYYNGPFPSATFPIAEVAGLDTYGESSSSQYLTISPGDRVSLYGTNKPFVTYPNNNLEATGIECTFDFIPDNSGERFYSTDIYYGGINGDTYYASGIGSGYNTAFTSTTEVYTIIPTSGTIKNLYVNLPNSVVNGNPATIKIRKNGVDTALTAILTYPDYITSNTSTTFTVQTGDLISISMNSNDYTSTYNNQGISVGWTFVADNPLETPLLLSSFGYENSDLAQVYRCEDQTSLSGSTLGEYSSCGEVGLVFNNVIDLDHLEGETVGVLANGVYLGTQTVSNGSVMFDESYSKVTVGLLYESDFETLNVELNNNGVLQGAKVKIGNVIFRLIDTKGGYIGPNEDTLYQAFTEEAFELSFGEQLTGTELFTGDIRVPLGSGFESGGRIFYRQSEPYPVTISAVIPEVGAAGFTR